MYIPPLSSWHKGDHGYWITVDGAELKLQDYGIGRHRWGASVTYPNGNTSYAHRGAILGPQMIGGSAADAYTFATEATPGKARELLAKAWGRARGKTRKNPDSWVVIRAKGKVLNAMGHDSTMGPYADKKKAKAAAKKHGGHLRGHRDASLSSWYGRGHPDVVAHLRGAPQRKLPPSQNVIVDEVDAAGRRTGASKHFRTRAAAEKFVENSYSWDPRAADNRYHYALRTKAPIPNPKRKGPSEQSRLYGEAAALYQHAMASGDREAIQRANALWSKGHSARRNPAPPSYLKGGFHMSGSGFHTREEARQYAERENHDSWLRVRATYYTKIVQYPDGFAVYFGPKVTGAVANPKKARKASARARSKR